MKWLLGLIIVIVGAIGGLIMAAMIAISIAIEVMKDEKDKHET